MDLNIAGARFGDIQIAVIAFFVLISLILSLYVKKYRKIAEKFKKTIDGIDNEKAEIFSRKEDLERENKRIK